jgi:hypothetical protein
MHSSGKRRAKGAGEFKVPPWPSNSPAPAISPTTPAAALYSPQPDPRRGLTCLGAAFRGSTGQPFPHRPAGDADPRSLTAPGRQSAAADGSGGDERCAGFSTSMKPACRPEPSISAAAANGAIHSASDRMVTAPPSLRNTKAGCATGITFCGRSTTCAAQTSSAFARRSPVMAICCCGSRAPRATSGSRGGAD